MQLQQVQLLSCYQYDCYQTTVNLICALSIIRPVASMVALKKFSAIGALIRFQCTLKRVMPIKIASLSHYHVYQMILSNTMVTLCGIAFFKGLHRSDLFKNYSSRVIFSRKHCWKLRLTHHTFVRFDCGLYFSHISLALYYFILYKHYCRWKRTKDNNFRNYQLKWLYGFSTNWRLTKITIAVQYWVIKCVLHFYGQDLLGSCYTVCTTARSIIGNGYKLIPESQFVG